MYMLFSRIANKPITPKSWNSDLENNNSETTASPHDSLRNFASEHHRRISPQTPAAIPIFRSSDSTAIQFIHSIELQNGKEENQKNNKAQTRET